MEPFGKTVHEQHSALIQQLVPKERLLEWNIEDGWDPLCRFLRKENPKTPFPRANDKGAFTKRVETDLEALGRNAIVNLLVVVLLILGLVIHFIF